MDASELPPLRGTQKFRKLRFEVIIDEGDPAVHLRYVKPVGSVNYRPLNGHVNVQHDYALMRTVNGEDQAVEY